MPLLLLFIKLSKLLAFFVLLVWKWNLFGLFLQFNINSIARCYVCRCRARFSSIHFVMFSSFAMNCKPYEVKKKLFAFNLKLTNRHILRWLLLTERKNGKKEGAKEVKLCYKMRSCTFFFFLSPLLRECLSLSRCVSIFFYTLPLNRIP